MFNFSVGGWEIVFHYFNVIFESFRLFFSICSLKFGHRLYLKVHLETVHTYEPDQAEELIKEQLKQINPKPQDFTVSL